MKAINLIVGLFFISLQASSQIQNPQVPTGQPGKPELPIPKIQPLKPADLLVTTLTFVSIVTNADTKTYTVRVIVTTRNDGAVQSAKTQLEGYTRSPSGGSSWKVMGSAVNLPSINPGRTYSAVFSFKGSQLTIGGVPFDFRVKADSPNFVAESDEANNFSESIVINPRAH